MKQPAQWVLLTDAGFDIGHGHLSRTAVMARAIAASGGRPLVCVPRHVPLDLGTTATTVVPFTKHDLGPVVAALDGADDLILIDLPDEGLGALWWLERLPVFRAAFRMFGPAGRAVEHVSLTPAYQPDETASGPGPEAEKGHLLPLVRLSGWGAIVVRSSLFDVETPDQNAGTEGLRSVLVTMGGSDPHDLTGLACGALAHLARDVPVVVAVGRGNPRFDVLSAEYGSVMAVVRPTEAEFDDLLRAATVAVISGGLTRYECMAAGTPFVAVAIHDQQAAITRQVTSRGFGLDLGPYERLAPGAVAGAAQTLLTDDDLRLGMIAGAREHVRPDTPVRIVERLTSLRATLPWQGT